MKSGCEGFLWSFDRCHCYEEPMSSNYVQNIGCSSNVGLF